MGCTVTDVVSTSPCCSCRCRLLKILGVVAVLRNRSTEFMLVSAAKEHPTDRSLAKLVAEVRAEPLYSFVQAQGNCILECTVLDNFETFKSMFK